SKRRVYSACDLDEKYRINHVHSEGCLVTVGFPQKVTERLFFLFVGLPRAKALAMTALADKRRVYSACLSV
ncbi:MAG: hypothetical protein IJI19_09145, partial [Ruminococcus sp.]|nr:hypothetical protein [Ruminococcus sp.]